MYHYLPFNTAPNVEPVQTNNFNKMYAQQVVIPHSHLQVNY